MRRACIPIATALLAIGVGCHREVEMVPLIEKTIYITDRFYDVQALSTDRAVVVGYGGKIIETTDGGRSWEQHPSGVEHALYAVRFVDDQHAWISGQDGVILHTEDGGKTWQKQESNAIFQDTDGSKTQLYLFGLHALDQDHAWAVGDRSILTSTVDGGKTWRARKVVRREPGEAAWRGAKLGQDGLTWRHGISFSDQQHGWLVGGYGLIYRTTDGGKSWLPSQG